MTTNIYIIRLEQNKYYIGEAINLEKRLNEHAEGKISSYTLKYKPINIKKIIPDSNPKHLDKYIVKYMSKYGMNSVRGGSFENEILNKEQIQYLINNGVKVEKQETKQSGISLQEQQMLEQKKYREEIMQQPEQVMQRRRPESTFKQDVLRIPIRNANGTCWICGLDGHYKENCNSSKEIVGYKEEEIDELGMFFKSNLRD
jgi:hypothetical protein